MIRIKTIVVDDEPPALNMICRYVNNTPFLELTGSFDNSLEALDSILKTPVQLVFLDIQMPDLSGIDLARQLPKETKIIFTTAFENYAFEGFKVNAIDYLLKPISFEEFTTASLKAKAWFDLISQSDEPALSYMFVKSGYKLVKIDFDDIILIEGLRDYVRFYLKSTDKSVMSLMNLKSLEELLPNEHFMRIHRSYIVCLNAIETIEKGKAIAGNHQITIASQYKEAFKAYLSSKSVSK
jgi:two-component system, LytTR family, response regulator LytT